MIQDSEVAHSSERVLFQYFEKAAEELGLKAWFNFLAPGRESEFQEIAVRELHRHLYPHVNMWDEQILRDAENHLNWEPSENPEEEIVAHYKLQAAIAVTLMGDQEGLKILAAQLVVAPMNWKLMISHFLGNLTDGRVGLTYKELPTRTQVLQWVKDIKQIQLTNKLEEIARLKSQ